MPTITVTPTNFDATVANSHIVLIDWGAQWCEPSRRFAQVFEASSDLHPEIVYAGIVGNRGQVLYALADKGLDKIGRNPAQPKTAHHDH